MAIFLDFTIPLPNANLSGGPLRIWLSLTSPTSCHEESQHSVTSLPTLFTQCINFTSTLSFPCVFAAEGDPESVVYATNSTTPNVSTTNPIPDVFLNASVHVGEISLVVENITAKINLQADVLQLLSFKAGVTASIDRVSLLIQNVNAKVLLEARLSNLVLMIGDVLDSLDLNPVLATLGQDLGSIVNTTVGAVSGATSAVEARSYNLIHNILYSINDYSGRTHTNRILAQNGSLIDQSLDNSGHIYDEKTVGYYKTDMTFNGYNQSVTGNNMADRELEYVYEPYAGLSIVSAIFTNAAGEVVGTQVLSESSGGGSSTVAGDL